MKYTIAENTSDPEEGFILKKDKSTNFLLHSSIRLFFANGGSDCYIVSVGTYSDVSTGVSKEVLEKGLEPLLKESEPTMLVIPDAMFIENKTDCYALQVSMIQHCGEVMKNRVSILDIWSDFDQMTNNKQWQQSLFNEDIKSFRKGIGNNHLMWAAAYFPWLHSTITGIDEVSFSNITAKSQNELIKILKNEVDKTVNLKQINNTKAEAIKTTIDEISTVFNLSNDDDKKGAALKRVHNTLLVVSPMYKAIMNNLRERINLLPPSGAMAGIYSMVDNSVGVWQSPANVSVGSVIRPVVNLNNDQQEDLNLPINGKAINAIRSFPGKGVLVWGARTLDGNSQDWRYISVRRTVIFIEQSIKYAAEAYVFEPNTANTWTNIKALITNFLTNVWQEGALAGATPEDAFSVEVGLGTTMTPVDLLDGIMRVTVKIAVTRPAEFIVITFEQQMQKS